MLYDKLNPDMQSTVDDYATRLAVLAWSRRSHLLAEASRTLGEGLPSEKAQVVARGFVTAVLERWGSPEVEDAYQASLYLASLDAGHRDMAKRWLDAHPEVRDAVDTVLGDA